MKLPKILFFISGPVPTLAEKLEAFDLGVPVSYRNALHVHRVDEECDGVAGSVPECYEDFPTGVEALEAYVEDMRRQRDKMAEVGGEPSDEQRGIDPDQNDQKDPATGLQEGGPANPTQSDEDAAAAAAAAAAGGKPPKADKTAKAPEWKAK
uniref:Uncharacterized protein n=1 Tax=Pseudomonas phage Pavpe01 TaxID=3138545 RepID=A0AAU6VZY1_9VIRU